MAKLSFKKNSGFTIPVSNIFISKHMPKANGSFVKVYFYGLMLSLNLDNNITNKDIATAFDMLESDVHNAWKYWEKAGVIKISSSSNNMNIEFLTLTEAEPKTQELKQKPTYHPKELDIYINNNSEISYLYKVAEATLGKPLSPNDASTLFGFYDWLRLPVEVIIMLLEYCSSIEKRNMRYIEKVAIDWSERGINDIHKVESFLKELDSKKSNTKKDTKNTKTKSNKFLNFSQDKYDFDEIDKLLTQKRLKGLKESRSS